MENALRHGGGSPVAVSVSCEIGGIGSIDGLTILEVADYGPGIPEDAREQIFEPLFRLPSGGSGAAPMPLALRPDIQPRRGRKSKLLSLSTSLATHRSGTSSGRHVWSLPAAGKLGA